MAREEIISSIVSLSEDMVSKVNELVNEQNEDLDVEGAIN